MHSITRRDLLKLGLLACHTSGWGVALGGCGAHPRAVANTLRRADANGVRLLPGLNSRVVAQSGQPPAKHSPYLWHAAPDGGACFPQHDGGWLYVSNSEMPNAAGGAGVLRFDSAGTVIDAYSILQGTHNNCAGGATPWGSWLSCEEVPHGQVWECDPKGVHAAVVRTALGRFQHEAVAVDPLRQRLYLTEDRPDGGLYRFTPHVYPDLAAGVLEIARRNGQRLSWHVLPDANASHEQTRYQLAHSATFNGGEGIVYHAGKIYFTTKGDNRVWALDVVSDALALVYDASASSASQLTGVDNITVASNGNLYVAEDGGDLQIVVITPSEVYALAQLQGHDASEVTGVAFSVDGKRLYFSSQRGSTGKSATGMTFEISGFQVPGTR
jgi:hypothetical protein